MSEIVYDVAVAGKVVAKGVPVDDIDAVKAAHPRCQTRKRTETRTVPAAFAVFVNNQQVGESEKDPGKAAKRAKKLGGTIRLVPA